MSRIIIDTDAGVDDALAILLALRSPKEIKVEAITTVSGNVHVDQATENVLRILEVFNNSVKNKDQVERHPIPPVYKGEAQPLKRELNVATNVHGIDGLGGSSFMKDDKGQFLYPAPTLAIEGKTATTAILDILAANSPGEITIVTLGPLTNIARALHINRDCVRRAKEIIVMGGSFEDYGNVTLAAEFNVWVDPEALDVLVGAGVPLTFVPLDVTRKVFLDVKTVRPFADSSLLAKFIVDITKTISEFMTQRYGKLMEGLFMHDPLAMSLVISNEIIPDSFRKVSKVFVECEGKYTSGKTLADLRKAPTKDTLTPSTQNAEMLGTASVCFKVNSDKFLELFAERVLKF